MSGIAQYQEQIFNSVNLGLIVVNAEGHILMWNTWMEKHSGIESTIAMQAKINTVFATPASATFFSAIQKTFDYGLSTVLSNALHRSPLPLFTKDDLALEKTSIHQSITVMPLNEPGNNRLCLIQVSDSSTSIKREKMLRSHSEVLKKDATTDSLTGLYNRRFFDEHYKMALGQAIRQKLPLSIFMVDIDYFKQYNDYYGHPTGDTVLIKVATTLRGQISRSSDMLARYGGEEFIMILPNMTEEHGLQFAEKLIQSVQALGIPHLKSKSSPHISVSVGLSTYDPSKHREVSALIDAADTALYKAKQNGRNRASFLALDTLIAHRHKIQTS
jgi:diguanylate cyclase (GGDEF)-like protein